MNVTKEELIPVFTGLGHKATVSQWNTTRFQAKIDNLPTLASGKEIADADANALLKKILKLLAKGKAVTVVAGDGASTPAPAKTAPTKGKKAKPAAEPEEDPTPELDDEGEPEDTDTPPEEDEDEGPSAAKNGKAPKEKKPKGEKKDGPKKVGVIDTIIECLQGATAKSPVTKAEILATLVKKFPDRDGEGMKKTINIQVPSRIKSEKGLAIEKNTEGYYIKG